MLTKKFVKKLSIMISCLLVIEIIALYPKTNEKYITKTINSTGIVYLLDNENYVSRLDVVLTSSNKIDRIKEVIDILTINNSKNYHIREGFKPIIPEKTKLLNVSLNNEQITLNFSKDILNISEELEEKMIESIIFSLTSIDNIKSIFININNEPLNFLPHSLKKLNMPLDRSFGINKEYDITNYNQVIKTTVYHLAKYKNYLYYVPVTKYSNTNKEKIEIIIEELKSSNTLNTNLVSFLSNQTQLINYNILEKSLILNFNNEIFTDINSHTIKEEVIYTINMSIEENYDKKLVIYYIDNKLFNNYLSRRG